MQIQKSSRPAAILLATVVIVITSICVVNATQSITTPNAATVSYSLAAGTSSTAITPITSKPVLVMGCCTTSPDQGVAQVSLLHIPSVGIQWVGLESFNGAAITQGFSSLAGTHIVWIDGGHSVDIQTASGDTIRVHNGSTITLAGNVTLVW